MKSTILIQSDSKEKIELFIKVAREMGLKAEVRFDNSPEEKPSVVSEPSERYKKARNMKKAFIAEASRQQLDGLLKIAKEMGITLHPLQSGFTEMNEEQEKLFWEKLSLQEMGRDWEQPSEDAWDDFIKSRLKSQSGVNIL
jgi:hypothetical protein